MLHGTSISGRGLTGNFVGLSESSPDLCNERIGSEFKHAVNCKTYKDIPSHAELTEIDCRSSVHVLAVTQATRPKSQIMARLESPQ